MNWLPIKGYEGLYEVSDTGKVRSLDRVLKILHQKDRLFKGRILATHANSKVKYYQVSLWRNNKEQNYYVHRLVAEAFIPNPQNLPEINHIDGNRQNNQVENLEWVNRLGNISHAISTKLRIYTNRMSETDFLDCLQAVIQGESYYSLSQRVPYKVPFLSVKIRQIARKFGLEPELDNSLLLQKQRRARINGNPYSKSSTKSR